MGKCPPLPLPPAPERARRSGRRRGTGCLLLAACLALGTLACGSHEADPAARASAAAPAVPVRVGRVERRNVPVQISAVGSVQAYSSVDLSPQVAGEVVQVSFDEGQEVHKGDLLFALDARPYAAALHQAQGQLARDQAEAANARDEEARQKKLLKQGVTSQSVYDTAQSKARSLEAAVRADQAQVEGAKLNLDYCQIRSPIDGRIGQILVHPGNAVKARETILARISQVKPVMVSFAVPALHLDEIRRAMQAGPLKVEVHDREDGEAPRATGRLTFVDPVVNANTDTVTLKATLPNEHESLWPGEFVTAMLTLETRRDAVVAPATAVETGQNGTYAFVVKKGNVVEMRPVTVGASVGQRVVVEKGLSPGEVVVVEGQLRLVPGSHVEVLEDAPKAVEKKDASPGAAS